jgi:predicted AlkP superfamily pyrophosphatase or phosphodiesterase
VQGVLSWIHQLKTPLFSLFSLHYWNEIMRLKKVILVLSDGLSFSVAVAGMGYLGHLVESKLASLYKVTGELPSMSRPMYETIHTGLKAFEHGVISNQVKRLSTQPNLFELAAQAGKTTAAAAYYWFSELYNRAPFDFIDDREVDDATKSIQHGRFYTQDDQPDIDLLATAGMLVRRYAPDYMLVHPMGMDYVGEMFGANSREYRNHASRQDDWLSGYISEWMSMGYNILVTGDHGMNEDGMHGGTTPNVREVPLFVISADAASQGEQKEAVSQLQIAPTVCKILGLPIPGTMKSAPIF